MIFPGKSFFHGTKADLKHGDLIKAGHNSNYGKGAAASYVYAAGTMNAAIWGAELAVGEGPGRIYVGEATGSLEDDPNLTDKTFPSNPTLSYRSRDLLRVIGEVVSWKEHSAEELKNMRDSLEELKQRGIEAID